LQKSERKNHTELLESEMAMPEAKGWPKEKATLPDLRPLNILKTPRKILMVIVVNRITRIWERRGVISNSQYGFRLNISCEGHTIQALNALEEAEESTRKHMDHHGTLNGPFTQFPNLS